MNLKELQAMIKEELENYMGEDEVDVDVDMDAGDIDADGAEEGDNAEDMLRNIYDMLKTKFEAEDEMGDMGDEGADDMDEADMDEEDMMGEVKDDDKMEEEADLEEVASTGFGDAGSKNTSGKDAGYTPAKTTRGDGKLHEGVARFQKLANIIK
jgi:hypothetical protein